MRSDSPVKVSQLARIDQPDAGQRAELVRCWTGQQGRASRGRTARACLAFGPHGGHLDSLLPGCQRAGIRLLAGLAYLDAGRPNTALVPCFHGFPDSALMWERLGQDLAGTGQRADRRFPR